MSFFTVHKRTQKMIEQAYTVNDRRIKKRDARQPLSPFVIENLEYVKQTYGIRSAYPPAYATAYATAYIVRFIVIPLYTLQARLINKMIMLCKWIGRTLSNEQAQATTSTDLSFMGMATQGKKRSWAARLIMRIAGIHSQQGTPAAFGKVGGVPLNPEQESHLYSFCRYLVPQVFLGNTSISKFSTPPFLTKSSLVFHDIERGYYEHI